MAGRILYLAHDVGDAAILRRRAALRAAGAAVDLWGFVRADRDGGAAADRRLGMTRNGAFLQRLWAIMRAAPALRRHRREMPGYDAILARNLEMLALACFLAASSGFAGPIVFECLDIHRLMLRRDPVGALMRALERVLLARCGLVVTSSPAFIDRYFKTMQGDEGAFFLAENKAPAGLAASRPGGAGASLPESASPAPLRVVYAGILRCRRSLAALAALARTMPGRVEVEIWGRPALDVVPDFHALIADCPGLRFMGAYRAQDLGAIYRDAPLVWAGDFYEEGGNSAWLLPNRLYEGLAFGAVPVAVRGTETARWLAAHRLGLLVEPQIETSLAARLAGLNPVELREARQRAASVAPADIFATPAEDARLLRAILTAPARRREIATANVAPADFPADPRVLIVVPILNEGPNIENVLRRLDEDPLVRRARIVVADGASTDDGPNRALAYAARRARPANPEWGGVIVLHNRARLQAAAVNVAMTELGPGADILIRIDAHADYPADYCSRLIAAARATGADSVVVPMRACAPTGEAVQTGIAAAQNSRLGAGGAAHRTPPKAAAPRVWVDHGHHALFRAPRFRALGGYDPGFSHNEDAEYDARLRRAGGRIALAPECAIDYFPRRDWAALARQYRAFGRGRARTLLKLRAKPRMRQLLPVAVAPAIAGFALGLGLAGLGAVTRVSALGAFGAVLAAPATIWAGACLAGGALLAVRARDWRVGLAAPAAAVMHAAWSAGFLHELIGAHGRPAVARAARLIGTVRRARSQGA